MTDRDPREAADDSAKSYALAIEEMRRRVFDWRKIEAALVDGCRMQGRLTENSEGDWYCHDINLTVLAKHLADELAGP